MAQSRFTAGMSLTDKIEVIVDGFVGSVQIVTTLGYADADLLSVLDELNIIGQDVFLVWSDLCGRNNLDTATLLIACHEHFAGLTAENLLHAARDQGAGIDVAAILAAAREAHKKFGG